jgi:N-acetylglucosaminyldiphosphoundecaprenol N-acetyl-beta-D-mannosaminyltransferase
MSKCNVLDIEYNNVTIGQASSEIYELALKGKGGYVVTPNAEIAQSCIKNDELRAAVNEADYVLPDGAGVVLASKICGEPLVGRAAGFDVSNELLSLMSQGRNKLFLLGAKPGIAQAAAENIQKKYSGVVISGVCHGYFNDESEIINQINAANPDVVFVALGYPRQEIFMRRNRSNINALMLGVGGSLDVFAGQVKRAPDFFIKLNLEWFYRLLCQPWRIGRMMKLPAYVFRAVAWRIKHMLSPTKK